MDSSSDCEKNKDGMCGEKLKEITLKTLLINSLLIWKYSSKTCGYNH